MSLYVLTITFSAKKKDAPRKSTPHHAGYGDGARMERAIGNIFLRRALRI
jgi:hypothetical protein